MEQKDRLNNLVNLKGTPGTEFTTDFSFTRKNKSSGVISGIVKNGATTLNDLGGPYFTDMFPTRWNGVPRDTITAKAMYNGDVYLWAKYKYPDMPKGSSSSSSEPHRFKATSGTEPITVFCKPDDKSKVFGSDTGGTLRQSNQNGRKVQAIYIDIIWNFDNHFYTEGSAVPEGAITGLKLTGSLNREELVFERFILPSKSCLYEGVEMVWKNNFWNYYHKVRYREYYPAKDDMMHWEQPYVDGAEVKWDDVPYRVMAWGTGTMHTSPANARTSSG